jgi:hypothetical protein
MATATNDKAIVVLGLELIDRGGPYDPREQQTIVNAADAQSERDAATTALGRRLAEVARKFRVLHQPIARPTTPYDRDVEDAAIALEASRLNEERLRDAMFDARTQRDRLLEQAWVADRNGSGLAFTDKSSTPERRRQAQQAYADAVEAWRAAEAQFTVAARRLNRLGEKRNEFLAINAK